MNYLNAKLYRKYRFEVFINFVTMSVFLGTDNYNFDVQLSILKPKHHYFHWTRNEFIIVENVGTFK
jgi:hypothetical protein